MITGRALRTSALAMLTTALVASCGSQTYGSAPAAPATPAPQVAAAESDVLDLYEQITGTVQDRRSFEYATFHAVQSYYQSCMKQAGLTYNVPVLLDLYKGRERLSLPQFVDELPETSLNHAQQHGLGIASRLIGVHGTRPDGAAAAAERSAAYHRLSPTAKTRYNDQISECQSAQPPGLETAPEPEGARQLEEKFLAIVSDAADDADVEALSSNYPSCMKAAGFPVPDRLSLLNTLENEYSVVLPEVHLGEVLNPQEAGFQAVRAREALAAKADAQCRNDAHNLIMEKLAPKVQNFEQDFAAEISQVRAGWDAIRSNAQRLREQSTW